MSYRPDPTGASDRFGRRSAGPFGGGRTPSARVADWQRTAERLFAWIRSRPAENWMFFGAGALIGWLFL